MIREGEELSGLIIVASGELVVVKAIDGIEFVIAKLRRGSVLNFRNVLYKGELSSVTVRCSELSTLLLLPQRKIHSFSESNSSLFSQIL